MSAVVVVIVYAVVLPVFIVKMFLSAFKFFFFYLFIKIFAYENNWLVTALVTSTRLSYVETGKYLDW